MAHFNLHPLHPIFAVAGIGIIALFAAGFYRLIPFYRRELLVESATRLTPLDGLRGILSFAVMYHHAAVTRGLLLNGVWEEPASNFFALMGESSVAFFFCITSFLFWSRALTRGGEIAPLPFFRGRIFRVVPLFWFAAACALWIVRKQIHWHRHATWIGLGKIAMMGLLPWGIIGKADVNMVNAGVTWTLQYEWSFYLALPAMALLIKSGGAWRWLFIAVACWVVCGLDQDVDFKAFFFTGMIAAHIARMPRTAAVLRRFYISIPIVFLLLSMPIFLIIGYTWWAFILTTLIFIPIACGNSMFGILNFSGLRMMGMVSYSVYLLHGMFLLEGRPYLQKTLFHGNFCYWLAISGLGCVVLIGCSLTYAIVEWPFIQLEKCWRKA